MWRSNRSVAGLTITTRKQECLKTSLKTSRDSGESRGNSKPVDQNSRKPRAHVDSLTQGTLRRLLEAERIGNILIVGLGIVQRKIFTVAPTK